MQCFRTDGLTPTGRHIRTKRKRHTVKVLSSHVTEFTKINRDKNFNQEDKEKTNNISKMNDKMEHSEKLLDNDAQYPRSAADDSNTGTSEDLDGAGEMRSQEGINKSQNTPLQNNTCHDKNDASETGTLLNSTVPEESGDQVGGTTSPIDKSGGARDNFADTGRTKCVCGENGTYFDGTHDDVVSYNFSSGDQNYDDAEPRDVLPDDVKSRGPDYENEKSGELKSDGTEPTAVVSSDAVSDEAEPSDVKSSSNETDGVSMGHVKACDDTGDRAVPSSNTGNDDNRQNEISTDTGSGEQTPSDRKEEGQRDEYSEKEFDASDSTVIFSYIRYLSVFSFDNVYKLSSQHVKNSKILVECSLICEELEPLNDI